jgi:hypothetical protein
MKNWGVTCIWYEIYRYRLEHYVSICLSTKRFVSKKNNSRLGSIILKQNTDRQKEHEMSPIN